MNNEHKDKQLPEITISLSYDKRVPKSELLKIKNSEDIYDILKRVFSADTFDWKEEMIMLCLSQANKVIGFYKVSSGGISSTICDPKVVFTVALNCGATSIIIAHNHPSGNLSPSEADRRITQKIKEGGRLLEISLLDHLILTDSGYYSFANDGLL